MDITIKSLSTNRKRWRFLWLKSVRNVDLAVHCARCLKGSYIKGELFGNYTGPAGRTTMTNLVLPDEPFYYLCGVASPYRYENNFHLALRKAPGEIITVDELGIQAVIQNAERIPIKGLGPGESRFVMGDRKEYYTCRNWQFANQVADVFNYTEKA